MPISATQAIQVLQPPKLPSSECCSGGRSGSGADSYPDWKHRRPAEGFPEPRRYFRRDLRPRQHLEAEPGDSHGARGRVTAGAVSVRQLGEPAEDCGTLRFPGAVGSHLEQVGGAGIAVGGASVTVGGARAVRQRTAVLMLEQNHLGSERLRPILQNTLRK